MVRNDFYFFLWNFEGMSTSDIGIGISISGLYLMAFYQSYRLILRCFLVQKLSPLCAVTSLPPYCHVPGNQGLQQKPSPQHTDHNAPNL